jgi:predicted dehydrogenase
MSYRLGILGLGTIAGGYSEPESVCGYTHATGALQSERVELVAAADLSAEARDAFEAKWGAQFPGVAYRESLAEMLSEDAVDILAVCVRGPHHFAMMMETLAHDQAPRAIFLEKPASCSLREMDEMCEAADRAGIGITVSYSRHWGPHVLRMAELIREGLIGEVTDVVGYCGGTFLSFASHTTDMICQFAGYCPTQVFASGDPGEGEVPDGYEPEPQLRNMIIKFDNGVVGTQIGCAGADGSFVCDVTGTQGRATIPFYGKPRVLDDKGAVVELVALGMPPDASPFTMAYDQIAGHLSDGVVPDCSGEAFRVVNEIGFAGIESALSGEAVALPNTHRERRIFANG